jgi:hypothetical protein
MEFPLYWRTAQGQDVFQRFRHPRKDDVVLALSSPELLVKRQMLAEYKTQQELTSVFATATERFRPAAETDYLEAVWSRYPFENRWRQLRAEVFFRNIAEFRAHPYSTSTSLSYS